MKKRSIILGAMLLASSMILSNNLSFAEENNVRERLTLKYAQDISNGSIRLENNITDSLLYENAILNPDADDDGDGVLNADEIYIYTKNGVKYIGYNSHPRLRDTDGDGYNDHIDKNPLEWNIGARDMAIFMKLAYQDDNAIDALLNPDVSLPNDTFLKEHLIASNELSHFWKLKESFHYFNGFDASLYEIDTERYPYLKNVQVLAIRGTDEGADIDDDGDLAVGKEPGQFKTISKIMGYLNSKKEIDNLYITGHSLGGYLAQVGNIQANYYGYKYIRNCYTFCAPRIYGNYYNDYLNSIANEGNLLTKIGQAIHYRVSNDPVISPVGFFKGVKDVGYSQNNHGSNSFFEPFMDKNQEFMSGERNQISKIGRIPEKNLEILKFSQR